MFSNPAFEAIDHLHLNVSDRPAAEAWYARVLGLRRLAAYEHWAQDGGPLTVADADGRLNLALFERPPQGGVPTIALRVTAAGLLA
jgi:catechol 2,3-dioxygenase-like lactoylglutathione lyase family enzyme